MKMFSGELVAANIPNGWTWLKQTQIQPGQIIPVENLQDVIFLRNYGILYKKPKQEMKYPKLIY